MTSMTEGAIDCENCTGDEYPPDWSEESMAEVDQLKYVAKIKLISAIFLTSCCALGLYGNAMSMLIFSRRSMRSPINCLLTTLSGIDFVLLIFITAVMIPNFNLMERYTYPYLVIVMYPLSTMTQTCSVWTFVIIAVERYIAVCHPLQTRRLLTLEKTKLAQFTLICCGVCYNVVRFWEYRYDSGRDMVVELLRENKFYLAFYFNSMHLLTHFLLPFLIIILAHLSIVISLQDVEPQLRNQRTFRRQRTTTMMILTVTFSFVAFNSIPFLSNLWDSLDRNLYDGPWWFEAITLAEVGNCLSVVNSSVTFLIYLAYCKKYRRLFLRYSLCGWHVAYECQLALNNSHRYPLQHKQSHEVDVPIQ